MTISATEQNYLKAIYKLSYRFGKESLASTGDLAKELSATPATVTDTLQRLSRKNLIHYLRYQGVTLTDEGMGIATDLIRLHRLWEVFLVEKLGYGWHEVHDIAEQLEHVFEEGLAERLDAFLGHPTHDPHGDPIVADPQEQQSLSPLSDLEDGASFTVHRVADGDTEWLQFAARQGLVPGTTGRIMEFIKADALLALLVNKKQVFISLASAEKIFVTPNA
jgi:DtxR family Mn-dependent transcriptional regulator